MKRLIRTWTSFTPGGAGSGTLVIPTGTGTGSEITTLELSRILLITNVTTKEIIYNPLGDPTKGGSVSGSTLTFAAATNGGGASASDKLQIWYESPGAKTKQVVCAATTNATSIKSIPGRVVGIHAANYGTEPAFLKLYDKASAPTVGTDVPKLTLMIPVSSAGAGNNIPVHEYGIDFPTGIALATTLTPTDASSNALTVADKVVVSVVFV